MNTPSEQRLTRTLRMGREQEMHVTIKSPEDQEKMRVAGRLAAEVLDMNASRNVNGEIMPAFVVLSLPM